MEAKTMSATAQTRALFVCKRRTTYGMSIGLVNSAQFVSLMLRSHGVESRVEVVTDANDVDRVVTQYNPTHVFVEAIWITPTKMDVLLRKHRKSQWAVRVHSNIPFLAHEGIAMEWLSAYEHINASCGNLVVAANSHRCCRDLNVAGMPSILLENIYWLGGAARSLWHPHREALKIGCFGAMRPMKNQLLQGVAAIALADRLGRKVEFHVNGTRFEQGGESVLRNLRAMFAGCRNAKLVEQPWLDHDGFMGLVSGMDLGMQVSFSETFNIVAADFVSAGVPVIVSPEMEWLPVWTKASTTDSESMVETAVLNLRVARIGSTIINRICLSRHNERVSRCWMGFVGECRQVRKP